MHGDTLLVRRQQGYRLLLDSLAIQVTEYVLRGRDDIRIPSLVEVAYICQICDQGDSRRPELLAPANWHSCLAYTSSTIRGSRLPCGPAVHDGAASAAFAAFTAFKLQIPEVGSAARFTSHRPCLRRPLIGRKSRGHSGASSSTNH